MEVAGRIPLLPQFFLRLLSTYPDLPHFFSLNQFFSCFLQLVPSILSLISPVYVFHSLHVPLPSSKHLPQVVSKHDQPPHTICPCQLICCFLQSQHVHQLHCIPLVRKFYTAHRSHHRSFCSSQNSYFIFFQTSRFSSI